MDSSVKWIVKMDCEEWIRLHIPQMDSAEIDFEPMDSVNGFSQNTRMDSANGFCLNGFSNGFEFE